MEKLTPPTPPFIFWHKIEGETKEGRLCLLKKSCPGLGGTLVGLVVKLHRSSCTRAGVVPPALRGQAAPVLPPTPAVARHQENPQATCVRPAVPSCPEGFIIPLGSQACWTALSQGPRRAAQWLLSGRPARGFLRWGAPCGPVTCEPRVLVASVTRSIKARGKALLQMWADRHKGSRKVSRWASQSVRWEAAAAAPSVLPRPATAVSLGSLGYDGRSRAEIETENKN